jgi:hypothetical protein
MRQSNLLAHFSSSPPSRRPRTQRRNWRRARIDQSESSGDDSDSDIAAIPLKRQSSQISESTDEDGVVVVSPPKVRYQNSPSKRPRRVSTPEEDEVLEQGPSRPGTATVLIVSDSEDEPLPRRKGPRTAVLDSDEEVKPTDRRLSKGTRPLSPEPDPLDEVDENGISNHLVSIC